MAGVKRSITTRDESPEPTKIRKLHHRSLSVDLQRLSSASCPKYKQPQEIAVFSAINSPAENIEKPKGSEDGAVIDKYAVQKSCARSLSTSATANRMDLIVPESLKNLRLDLNRGYGSQIQKDNDNEFMSILLQCLYREKLVNKSEFVCWRGLLTKIGASPYDAGGRFDDGMKIVAQKIGDTIYMYEFPTEQYQKKQETLDERQKLMQYWGMKFESYLTAKPGEKPNIEESMNFNLEYGAVVSTKLGSHSLIFGGEVDCSLPENGKHYVELKTTRECHHEGQERSFRKFKLLKWWLQSFLIGIEDILCGYRDDNGIVKRCRWFKVSDIPQIIKQDRDHWKPAACLTFIEQYLDFVKASITEELVPHVFTRAPGDKVFNMVIDKDGVNKFLPQWFVDNVRTVCKK